MGPSFASPATCISETRSTRIPGTPHSRARSRRSIRRTLAAQQGTKVVVLLFPTKEEVYLPLLNQPVPRPAAPFAAELARRGIDYLDLTGTFTARARAGRSLYFELDPHPNQPGYTLAASAEAIRYSLSRERGIPLLAGKALLLRRGDDLPVAQQGGGAVVIVGRDAKYVRSHGLSPAPRRRGVMVNERVVTGLRASRRSEEGPPECLARDSQVSHRKRGPEWTGRKVPNSPWVGRASAGVSVHRDVQVAVQLSVAAQERLPRNLGTLAATLGHDLHPFGRDRHGVELALDLQLPLERLVQTCGHRVLLPVRSPRRLPRGCRERARRGVRALLP